MKMEFQVVASQAGRQDCCRALPSWKGCGCGRCVDGARSVTTGRLL